jgi:2-polyprenyl-3-methyl-5-hydroxy-6-metoxy-1,4-benzoquinol methylase
MSKSNQMPIATPNASPSAERLSDAQILKSWQKNAAPWIQTLDEAAIESRVLVTNQAVLDAISSCAPESVLDIGCGEGWLAHRLAREGKSVMGVDAVPALISAARERGPGEFQVLDYEQLAQAALGRRFDLAVCNFSLIGKESVEGIFRAMPQLLNPNGYLVVQTLHPRSACGELPYTDGWREGSWKGFSPEFSDPPAWYFRTLESWQRLFQEHQLVVRETRAPQHSKTGQAASVIFIAQWGAVK